MNGVEVERLAAAIGELRTDWPVSSLDTFIRRELGHRAYRDVAVAMAWIACDPETKTPKRVLENGPWWAATLPTDASRHPSTVPIAELCHHCGRARGWCQSALVQEQDPHPYRTVHEAALERKRADEDARRAAEKAGQPWSPTDAIDQYGMSDDMKNPLLAHIRSVNQRADERDGEQQPDAEGATA